MKLVYVGEAWHGSNARSLAEALAGLPGVEIHRINESESPPRDSLPHRVLNRLTQPLRRAVLGSRIKKALSEHRPDALVVYKGNAVGPEVVSDARAANVAATVNVFPDYSPHAYGARLQEAIGRYDLVVSTKHYHAPLWSSLYGYQNRCVYVPHGYDPQLHLWNEAAPGDRYDVAWCATWRPEYERLATALAQALSGDAISVAIAGSGWMQHRRSLPAQWHLSGPLTGRAYGQFLRSAKIVIAPLNREAVIRGKRQPGDEDTARTYELAAAHCFFLHQRTPLAQSLYDERLEVPMWEDAMELAALIRRWLPDRSGREAMAAQAHARAVPAYSTTKRAESILAHVESLVGARRV